MISWLKRALSSATKAPASTEQGTDDSRKDKEQGDAFLREGKLEEASECYRNAIALDRNFAKAHCNLGFVLKEQGKWDEAEKSLKQATSIDPTIADAHYFLGTVTLSLGKGEEAISHFTQALHLDPQIETAYLDLSYLYFRLGAITEAKKVLGAGLDVFPLCANLHYLQGNIHVAEKLPDAAIIALQKALSLDKNHLDAHTLLGDTLLMQHDLDRAIAHYDQALALNPNLPQILNNKGLALQFKRMPDAATECFQRAISLDKSFYSARINLGNAFQDLGNYSAAVTSYLAALEISPDNADACNSLGSAYEAQKDFEQALIYYKKAVELAPRHLDAHLNMGGIMQRELKLDEAERWFDAAIAIDPNYADARWNKAVLLLLTGRFSDGWREYEYRWKRTNAPSQRKFDQPMWDGKTSLSGKTILLHTEQGLGDTIQFVRHVHALSALGARIVLEVYAPLWSLLAANLPQATILSMGANPPYFDFHCPLTSLPLVLGIEVSSIPSNPFYLAARPERIAPWADQLRSDGRPRIGLVWSGNPAHSNDTHRSIPLEKFLPLCTDKRFRFFSLQKDARPNDAVMLQNIPDITDLASHLTDYEETAAIIANLDLVVTVDTSVAHLAGAIGKPVWILLPFFPDFRWLLERTDSPWYPSARLFRQPAIGDWATVIENVHTSLEATFA